MLGVSILFTLPIITGSTDTWAGKNNNNGVQIKKPKLISRKSQ